MSKTKELSQVLDELIACGEGLIKAANAIREILPDAPEPEAQPAVKEEATTAPAEEPQKKYSFADVRKAFSAKSHAGYTEQVKALITRYGAAKLSGVKEEDYPALMADLEAIT